MGSFDICLSASASTAIKTGPQFNAERLESTSCKFISQFQSLSLPLSHKMHNKGIIYSGQFVHFVYAWMGVAYWNFLCKVIIFIHCEIFEMLRLCFTLFALSLVLCPCFMVIHNSYSNLCIKLKNIVFSSLYDSYKANCLRAHLPRFYVFHTSVTSPHNFTKQRKKRTLIDKKLVLRPNIIHTIL